MPTLDEYLGFFTLKDLIFALVVFAVIILAREEKRIFRRKK